MPCLSEHRIVNSNVVEKPVIQNHRFNGLRRLHGFKMLVILTRFFGCASEWGGVFFRLYASLWM